MLTGLAKLKESEREKKKETTKRGGDKQRARESERERARKRESESESEKEREREREQAREKELAHVLLHRLLSLRESISRRWPPGPAVARCSALTFNVPPICACAGSPAYLSSYCSGAGKPHAVDDYYIWREWRRRIMLDSQMIKFRDPRLLTRLRSLAIFVHTMCLLITNVKGTFIGMSKVST